jgi:hypothetical protein
MYLNMSDGEANSLITLREWTVNGELAGAMGSIGQLESPALDAQEDALAKRNRGDSSDTPNNKKLPFVPECGERAVSRRERGVNFRRFNRDKVFVGIHTAFPDTLLDVNGDAKVRDDLEVCDNLEVGGAIFYDGGILQAVSDECDASVECPHLFPLNGCQEAACIKFSAPQQAQRVHCLLKVDEESIGAPCGAEDAGRCSRSGACVEPVQSPISLCAEPNTLCPPSSIKSCVRSKCISFGSDVGDTCVAEVLPDGTVCDDNNALTANDVCESGACVGTPITDAPSASPTLSPSLSPSRSPSRAPTAYPSLAPTKLPTVEPTPAPTTEFTVITPIDTVECVAAIAPVDQYLNIWDDFEGCPDAPFAVPRDFSFEGGDLVQFGCVPSDIGFGDSAVQMTGSGGGFYYVNFANDRRVCLNPSTAVDDQIRFSLIVKNNRLDVDAVVEVVAIELAPVGRFEEQFLNTYGRFDLNVPANETIQIEGTIDKNTILANNQNLQFDAQFRIDSINFLPIDDRPVDITIEQVAISGACFCDAPFSTPPPFEPKEPLPCLDQSLPTAEGALYNLWDDFEGCAINEPFGTPTVAVANLGDEPNFGSFMGSNMVFACNTPSEQAIGDYSLTVQANPNSFAYWNLLQDERICLNPDKDIVIGVLIKNNLPTESTLALQSETFEDIDGGLRAVLQFSQVVVETVPGYVWYNFTIPIQEFNDYFEPIVPEARIDVLVLFSLGESVDIVIEQVEVYNACKCSGLSATVLTQPAVASAPAAPEIADLAAYYGKLYGNGPGYVETRQYAYLASQIAGSAQ